MISLDNYEDEIEEIFEEDKNQVINIQCHEKTEIATILNYKIRSLNPDSIFSNQYALSLLIKNNYDIKKVKENLIDASDWKEYNNQNDFNQINNCQICTSEINLEKLTCKHIFCQNCLQSYIDNTISENEIILLCPSANCEELIEDSIFNHYCTNTHLERYYINLYEDFISKSENLKYCGGCNKIIEIKMSDFINKSELSRIKCLCGHSNCFLCNENESHFPCSCDLYAEWLITPSKHIYYRDFFTKKKIIKEEIYNYHNFILNFEKNEKIFRQDFDDVLCLAEKKIDITKYICNIFPILYFLNNKEKEDEIIVLKKNIEKILRKIDKLFNYKWNLIENDRETIIKREFMKEVKDKKGLLITYSEKILSGIYKDFSKLSSTLVHQCIICNINFFISPDYQNNICRMCQLDLDKLDHLDYDKLI